MDRVIPSLWVFFASFALFARILRRVDIDLRPRILPRGCEARRACRLIPDRRRVRESRLEFGHDRAEPIIEPVHGLVADLGGDSAVIGLGDPAGDAGDGIGVATERDRGEIRCQFIFAGNPVSVHFRGNPVSVHFRGGGGNPVSGNPVSVHFRGGGGNPVSVHFRGKSGVSSGEIRCQFRGNPEIRCQFIFGEIRCRGKSGVSSFSWGKSGVSSFSGKSGVRGNPVSVHFRGNPVSVQEIRKSGVSSFSWGKSGVSSFSGKSGVSSFSGKSGVSSFSVRFGQRPLSLDLWDGYLARSIMASREGKKGTSRIYS